MIAISTTAAAANTTGDGPPRPVRALEMRNPRSSSFTGLRYLIVCRRFAAGRLFSHRVPGAHAPGYGYVAASRLNIRCRRYEISNYARSGYECRHNLHYWRIEPYLGFGPSAHGFDGTRRWWNVNNLNQYLARVESGSPALQDTELLTPVELINERIGFGLRIAEGFNLDNIPVKYRYKVENQIEFYQKKWPGCLATSDNRWSLTSKGLLFADAIAVDMQLGI